MPVNRYNLLEILENGDEDEKVIAAEAIARLGLRDALPHLIRALETVSFNHNRDVLIRAIGHTGNPDAVTFLLDYAMSKSYKGMYNDARAQLLDNVVAEALGNTAYLPQLIVALQQGDSRARRIAGKAIGKIHGH